MKRKFDFLIAFFAMLTLAPIFIMIAIVVRVKLGRPIIFRQQRPGLSGRPFEMMKFRTMTDERHENGELLPDDGRLTGFGTFLRSSSLDELPGLWSVLVGDMSLVGPRPLLMEYLPLYSERQQRRHDVRPGITGWAQVNGRNSLSWEEKFEFDVWYVENRTFWLDLKILFMTVGKVLKHSDVAADGHVTMQKFTGNGS